MVRLIDSNGKVVNMEDIPIWKCIGEDAERSVYSDRLFQWDSKKYDKCCMKIWNNKGQYFDSRKPEDIEKFLCLYFGKEIKLVSIYEYENKSTGYPYWRFDYKNI